MRRHLSSKERLRLFTLHGGICHICGVKIAGAFERWEIEHQLALELGGADDDENMKPAHARCHKPKTATDLGMIAKAKRQEIAFRGAKARSGRPMPVEAQIEWNRCEARWAIARQFSGPTLRGIQQSGARSCRQAARIVTP